jgi:uncharacterized repeat protein (TIGR01451 family)
MYTIINVQRKLSLVVILVLLLTLIPTAEQVFAQWPPFSFRLIPSYENGQITYGLIYSNRVDWPMTDVTIKIPLPAGTRFVEGSAGPRTSVSFDGAEVTFSNNFVGRPIRDARLVIEVIDPEAAVFTTRAWISWQGDHPGDYLTKDVSVDISKQTLNWQRPRSPLQLEASAAVADEGVVTYAIYPRNVRGRMWDLRINVPVPEGTTFLSAEAPYPFQASFDGQEVSFFAVELERWSDVGPLSVRISTEGVTTLTVVTRAWATWRNAGRGAVGQQTTVSGDIIVQPSAYQSVVVSDMIGDVPLSNYDLTGVALQKEEGNLKVIFYTVGYPGALDEPLEFSLFIDGDCNTNTGVWRNYRGVEYWVRYRLQEDRADLRVWDEEVGKWRGLQPIEVEGPDSGRTITVWVPLHLLEDGTNLCWVGQARNLTKAFYTNPPSELIPNGEQLGLTEFSTSCSGHNCQ